MRQPADRGVRAILTTALDLLVIVAASISLVLALGAHTQLTFAGLVIISLTDPWRPLLFALVGVAVRLAVSGSLPPLPAVRRPSWPLEDEREWFATAKPLPAGIWRWAAGLVVLCLVPLWPQLANMRAVPDPGDPFFSAWRLAWIAHQLVTSPAHLFDANILYPRPLTLTYSDAVLLQGLIGAPFIWLGADPLVVSNTLLVAAFPLTALGFFYAAWRLTGDLRAAFVAGLMGGLYPFHFEHYSHLELQYFLWVPLAIVALLRFLADPRRSTALVFSALVVAQWLSSLYFGVMLLTFLIPFGALVCTGWRLRPSAMARHAALAGVVMLVPIAIATAPYLASRDARGDRPIDVILHYSAAPEDYSTGHQRSSSQAGRFGRTHRAERELFPGVTPLLFGAAGMAPPLRVSAIATIVSGALALDWSFGLRGLTYATLHRWLTPYQGMRVPARFSVFVGSALVLLSAFGLARLFRRLGGVAAGVALAVLCASVLIDLRLRLTLSEHWRVTPPIYASVTPDMVLAEFPMGQDEAEIAYMYFSTTHWARLVNGYSGYLPEPYIILRRELEGFPRGDTLARLKRQGATHVTVNCRLFARPGECREIIATLDGSPDVSLVSAGKWEAMDVRLYALR